MKSRKVYIDFVKAIAIFLVLFNHTGNRGFLIASQRLGSVFYPLYLCTAVLVKVAVPLFFMASGALLLSKEEPLENVLKRRFIKYFLSLIIFSGIVYLYKIASGEITDASIRLYFTGLYTGTIAGHLWYFYAYLAYVLMLPLMRKFVKILSLNDVKWILLLHFVSQLIPMVLFLAFNEKLSIQGNFNLFVSINYFLFPVMGYFIDNAPIDKRLASISVIASALSIVATCCVMHYNGIITGRFDESYLRNMVFIHTGTLFYLSKYLFDKCDFSEIVKNVISTIGSLTFGIYVLECIYRKVTEPVFYFLEPHIGAFASAVIWIFAACTLGGFVTYVLKHMPGMKQLL